MDDPFKKLYDDISRRKAKPADLDPYQGGNGRIDRAVDLILNEDFPRSGCLIDVGGATGNLGYALREHFEHRWVVDIAEECREAAEAKGNHFYGVNVDVRGFRVFEDNGFDLVVALDFIEHIIDPEKFARECFRVLRPGGKVLINTPNIQYWRHLHSLVVEGVFPHTSGDREVYHGGHVAFFNEHDLEEIFRGAGFRGRSATHLRGLTADPPPPVWTMVSKVPAIKMSYGDLIWSVTKQ